MKLFKMIFTELVFFFLEEEHRKTVWLFCVLHRKNVCKTIYRNILSLI